MARSCYTLWNAEILAISPFKNSFPTPHHPTPFIFAIFMHSYFATRKSVGILCVCLKERMGAVQDYTYWGQRRTITHIPSPGGFPTPLCGYCFNWEIQLTHRAVNFLHFLPFTQHFLPFCPAIPSFLPSNSFPSTQHFLTFYPALPSFLPSTFFLSTNTSFLAAWHFLTLSLGPFLNIF